ncbi:hypothetical protein BCR34DRAFT_596128 [Clohesyomyces aquaticus]|uniref:Uncharacterized protein n=1 Tax=Clohesyomyces aquaticus TaxID=1231657 RepID=A0A1Y2A7Q7_9PLEO|nr:hypothetical protein BCR34DRAFT_596128 [Clohesyomyces aquaticus]
MPSGSGSDSTEDTCNMLRDATDDTSPYPDTTIPELLSEFSALLSLDRYTPSRKRRYYPYTKPAPHVYTPPDPKLWTEPFSILSLPRELRDTIYTYALYSPPASYSPHGRTKESDSGAPNQTHLSTSLSSSSRARYTPKHLLPFGGVIGSASVPKAAFGIT